MQTIESSGALFPLFAELEPAEKPARAAAPVAKDEPLTFPIGDHRIEVDPQGLVSLTALWRAAGSPDNRSPSEWKRYAGAEFVASLAATTDTGKSRIASGTGAADMRHVWRSQRGGRNGGGAFAHWQIALAYAAYLSPAFHRHVNAAFVVWSQEHANPELKIERAIEGFERKGATRREACERAAGIVQRVRFTDAVKEAGATRYGQITSALYTGLYGVGAAGLRQAKGLPQGTNLRNHMDAVELAEVRHAEAMAEAGIRSTGAAGDLDCSEIARAAGEANAISRRIFEERMAARTRRA